jgi:translation elongation factor EF-Ts
LKFKYTNERAKVLTQKREEMEVAKAVIQLSSLLHAEIREQEMAAEAIIELNKHFNTDATTIDAECQTDLST